MVYQVAIPFQHAVLVVLLPHIDDRYEMTFVNAQNAQERGRGIVGNAQEHMEGTRTRQIPALATLLYVD